MSRIEEALKRAREAGEAGTVASLPRSVVPGAHLFTDAWNVPEERAEPEGERSARPESEPAPASLAVFQEFSREVAEKIVVTPTVKQAFAEQYRRLAGTLHHAQVERGIKVVMVTSALAGEGKTLTCTNLALTFSESYRRSVLLVDADLRRPTLHDIFQVPNISGLGDNLRAEGDTKLTLVEITPRLTLLTAGRPDPDPMHGLTSKRMKRVLDGAAARYDWVLIDTPPVGLLPDANLLAGMVDSALLVVRAGQTPYNLVQRAVAAIGRERILGVVLNQAEEGVGGSSSYYSYYDAYGKK